MSLRKPLLLFGAVAIAAGMLWLGVDLFHPRITGDGVGLYAPLATIFIDRDLDLANEFAHSDGSVRRAWLTDPKTGRYVSPYPVGASVLWFAPVAVAWLFDPQKSAYGLPDRFRHTSPGFQKRYVIAVAIGTLLQTLAGAALLRCILRKHEVRAAHVWLSVAATVLGTPVLYYTLSMPSYAHSASFLASTALLCAALHRSTSRRSLVLLGALWGLVTLVRYQDAVLGIVAAPRIWSEVRRLWPGGRAELLLRLVLFAGTALLVFTPQLLFWQAMYGGLLVTQTSILMNWTRPAIFAFLFSTWQGAVLWMPALVLGVLGLLRMRDRGMRAALLAAVALEIYACAATADWWGSASCGPRRLTAVAPFIGLGVGLGLEHGFLRRPFPVLRQVAVVACILWTIRLTQYYDAGLLPKNPANPVDYVPGLSTADPNRRPWGHWEYGRWGSDLARAERRIWSL